MNNRRRRIQKARSHTRPIVERGDDAVVEIRPLPFAEGDGFVIDEAAGEYAGCDYTHGIGAWNGLAMTSEQQSTLRALRRAAVLRAMRRWPAFRAAALDGAVGTDYARR